jgi:hypothetical protein
MIEPFDITVERLRDLRLRVGRCRRAAGRYREIGEARAIVAYAAEIEANLDQAIATLGGTIH